jgi:hypothetical protein
VLIFLKHEPAAVVTVSAVGALVVSAIPHMIAMGQFDVSTSGAPFAHVRAFALIAGLLVGGCGCGRVHPGFRQGKQFQGNRDYALRVIAIT